MFLSFEMSNPRIILFHGSIATQSQMNSEPTLIKVSSMINSVILFLLKIIFFGLYFCIQFHIETWFRLIKQDNLLMYFLKIILKNTNIIHIQYILKVLCF